MFFASPEPDNFTLSNTIPWHGTCLLQLNVIARSSALVPLMSLYTTLLIFTASLWQTTHKKEKLHLNKYIQSVFYRKILRCISTTCRGSVGPCSHSIWYKQTYYGWLYLVLINSATRQVVVLGTNWRFELHLNKYIQSVFYRKILRCISTCCGYCGIVFS